MDKATTRFYGFGGLALGIAGNAVTYFLMLFYNQVLGIPAHLVGMALAVALIFDAISDPLMGMISDRTRSVWGRRHPYIYAAAIPMTLSYWFLWNPPDWILVTSKSTFIFLTINLILFRTAMTCFDVPSNAMVPELTKNYDQRTRMMSARVSTAWVGGVAFTILMYGYFLQPTELEPVGILNKAGYQSASWLGACLMLTAIIVSAIGTHKHIGTLGSERPYSAINVAEFYKTVGSILSNQAFRTLMAYAIVWRSTDGLLAALWIYLMSYFWLINSDQIAILSGTNFIGAVIALIITPWLARGLNKRTVIIFTNLGFLFTSVLPVVLRLYGFVTDDRVFAVLLSVNWLGVLLQVITLSLMASMITDVVEDIQKTHHVRHEGAVVSAQTFVEKVSSAAGTWAAGMILLIIGFPENANVGEVATGVVRDLGQYYAGIVAGVSFVSVLLLLRFKLNREQHEENLLRVGTV